jgi:hypothetical protein
MTLREKGRFIQRISPLVARLVLKIEIKKENLSASPEDGG